MPKTTRQQPLRTVRIRQLSQRFIASSHCFPLVCAVILLILTGLRISGTSVGLYHIAYYGPQAADSNLLAGHPRSIRSDELLFNTPATVGQVKTGSPYVSDRLGQAENMSVIADVPYKDWSVIFKPQNLPFFVLPLEYAFALKWWLLGFLVLVSCYYFCLTLLPGKRLWSVLIALSVFFSPFVQWWYQISTTACLFYCFFIGLIVMHLLRPRLSTRRRWLLGTALAYCLVCFGLVLYPPFQIPCALVTGVFIVGYFLETRQLLPKRQLKATFVTLGTAVLSAVAIMFIFAKTRMPVVEAVTHTAYPGKRIVPSGGFSVSHFLSSHLSAFFQSDGRAAKYPLNQSEASNFITLSPFLLAPSVYVIGKTRRQSRPLPWMLIGLTVLLIIFLCRLFVPHLDSVFKVLQLSSTPLVRMMLAIGLLGVMQLVVLIRYQAKLPAWLPWITAGITALVSIVAGLRIQHGSPGFIDNSGAIVGLSLVLAVIVWCVQQQSRFVTAGLSLLALLAFGSAVNVNPLYRGLQPLTHTPIAQAIGVIGQPNDVWAVSGTRLIVSQPFAEGKRALTGIYLYPQPAVWQPLGSDAPAATYNRFAHVIVNLDPTGTTDQTKLELKATDHFTINTSACSAFLRQAHVKYLITMSTLPADGCAHLVKTVTYPMMTFYIYRLDSTPLTGS